MRDAQVPISMTRAVKMYENLQAMLTSNLKMTKFVTYTLLQNARLGRRTASALTISHIYPVVYAPSMLSFPRRRNVPTPVNPDPRTQLPLSDHFWLNLEGLLFLGLSAVGRGRSYLN